VKKSKKKWEKVKKSEKKVKKKAKKSEKKMKKSEKKWKKLTRKKFFYPFFETPGRGLAPLSRLFWAKTQKVKKK
jgi:hypothetical protein